MQEKAGLSYWDLSLHGSFNIAKRVAKLVASELHMMLDGNGEPKHMCYARPVTIGNHVWLGANVAVCGSVKIGDSCVIGTGSMVTRDLPPNSLAASVPCRVIREITEADSMRHHPEILADCHVIDE